MVNYLPHRYEKNLLNRLNVMLLSVSSTGFQYSRTVIIHASSLVTMKIIDSISSPPLQFRSYLSHFPPVISLMYSDRTCLAALFLNIHYF